MRTEPPKLRSAYDVIDGGGEGSRPEMPLPVSNLLTYLLILLILASPALLWALYHWAFFTQ